MPRTYTTTNLIQLPRLSGREAIVLITEVETAFDAAKAHVKPKALPAPVVRSMARMKEAVAPLAAILAPRPADDTQAKRKADRVIDAAWAAFYSWLGGWCLLPESKSPYVAKAIALNELIFSDGLAFTQLRYKIEWQESETRLQTIDEQGYAGLLKDMGGAVFLENIQKAHADYGDALHIKKTPPPPPAPAEVRTRLLAALDALRDYTARVAAVADPDEPGSDELSEMLLRPILEWETKSSGEEAEEAEEAAPPAGTTAPADEDPS